MRRTSPSPAQAQSQMKSPESEVRQDDHSMEGSENGETQIPKGHFLSIAVNNEESRIPGSEPSTGEKERLMVKLKYKTNISATSPPSHRTSNNASSTSSSSGATSEGVPKPSIETPLVKQEVEDRGDTAWKKSNSIYPQIKIEKNSDDQSPALKPLNESAENSGQVSMIKDEVEPDAHQVGEMNIDVPLGGDATRIPTGEDGNITSSNVVGIEAAASGPENSQDDVTTAVRPVDDVNGDHEQTAKGSPEASLGEITAFDNPVDMSDPCELDEWVTYQNNHTADTSSGQQQHHHPIDHRAMSSAFTDDGMMMRQEGEIDQQSLAFLTGEAEAQVPWSQRHQAFTDPVRFTSKSASPHHVSSGMLNPAAILRNLSRQNTASPSSGSLRALNRAGLLKSFPVHETHSPRYGLQQPSSENSKFDLNPGFDRQKLQAEVEEKQRKVEQTRKLLHELQQQSRQVPHDFAPHQNQPSALPLYLTGPMSYTRAPQGGYQQMNRGKNSSSLLPSSSPYITYGHKPQIGPNDIRSFPEQSILQPDSEDWMPKLNTPQGIQKARTQFLNEHDRDDKGGASDDDEPLRTRVERHPSVTSQDFVISGHSPTLKTKSGVSLPPQDDNSDVEFLASNTMPRDTEAKIAQKFGRMPRPLPQPTSSSPMPADTASPSSDSIEQIDWALPRYDVQRQPLEKGEDIPSAKVSLPGMVREEVLLSPDHADEEARLLINLFIPSQQALASPDPEPAVALLNFHTIAVMVIEAYVQFEIGDEFGTGRGHYHQDHDRGEEEYERMREATDADSNEIFFAVVDRYRAGLESKKQPLQLIRGTQEFCDVALDIIYHIKEHGLLRPEPKAKKVRADKGVKRGPQTKAAATEAATTGKGKGVKRGTAAKPNEVQPRKKAKIAPAVLVKNRKAKVKEPELTVVKRRAV
jgi:hypothetical protein